MARIFSLLACVLALTTVHAVEITQLPTVEVTGSNAVVRWLTDSTTGTRATVSPASARVVIADKTPGSTHIVKLADLHPGTTYTVTVGSARVWLATNTFTTTGDKGEVATKKTSVAPAEKKISVPPTRKIWGNPESLPDHFARHGADFHAKDADDYARLSWEFFQRAKNEGLPAKRDDDGTLRVFDPRSGTFAAYNRDGTTKTFFKPGSRDYFDRQPGDPVKLVPKK
jgi:hypothetical protein